MSIQNFAQSQPQKLDTNLDTEQLIQSEELGSMTGELEENELDTISGGLTWWGELGRFAGRPVSFY
jgi:hypothetical protein